MKKYDEAEKEKEKMKQKCDEANKEKYKISKN